MLLYGKIFVIAEDVILHNMRKNTFSQNKKRKGIFEMKKILAILLCLCMVFAVVACNKTEKTDDTTAADVTTAATEETTEETTTNGEDVTPVEAEYKLGMGIVVDTASSSSATADAAGTAQIDATVAAVVLDKDGKIVSCRIDAVQNKIAVAADGTITIPETFKTKMEQGDAYGMAAAVNYGMDWNGDGVVKEWYDQAKAFENYVVGMTAAEVEAMATKEVEGKGYIISADDALLSAGCTIQITDFKAAVVKACNDEQGMSFKTASTFTLGVAATSANDGSADATAVQVYSDFAAAVVVDGKIVATLNDAIQPKIAIDATGAIGETTYVDTKRCLKEGYNMALYGSSMDWNGDGEVKEWYLQSAVFSNYVLGKTAAEVADMATKTIDSGYVISADDALLSAGCTIQITAIKAVVAQAVTNAR